MQTELLNPLIFTETKKKEQETDELICPLIFESSKAQEADYLCVDVADPILAEPAKNPACPTVEISSKPTPYDAALAFCKKIPLIVCNEQAFLFNGRFYEKISVSNLQRKVIDVCRSLICSVGKMSFVKDAAEFLLKEPMLCCGESQTDENFIAFSNGLLNLQTERMQPHHKYFRVFYGISANFLGFYEQTAYYFDAFLHSLSGGDQALKTRILEMIGYCLAPEVKGKCFFVLQGVGNSGKSVLCTLLQMLLNLDAVMTMNAHELSREFAVAELQGKKLILSPDLPDEPLDSKAVSRLKQLTGSDEVSSNVKFGAYTKFRSQAAIVLATNHPILIKNHDEAFLDRAVVIPFRFAIPRESRCLNLNEKLYAERDIIVSKAMAAYMKLRQRGYRFSGDFRLNEVVDGGGGDSLDSKIFLFIRENLIVCEGGVVFAEDLHAAYVKSSGYIPINDFSQRFNRIAIEEFPVKKARKRRPGAPNAISCFIGIAWRDDEKEMSFSL